MARNHTTPVGKSHTTHRCVKVERKTECAIRNSLPVEPHCSGYKSWFTVSVRCDMFSDIIEA